MQPNPIQNVQSTLTNDLSDMKIKLEFVLQEQKLSLAQLSEFFEGEVLKIDPQATAAIQVRVSGQVVAVGELVRLDDSLAVELRQICRGVGNE
ncbi:hypothetical protein PS865_04431 [Pseudomonas fluorescens]|nr:hypothetical protein PS865_04431 [Pseudomonas fluorescens]